jgi:hypothetical protein
MISKPRGWGGQPSRLCMQIDLVAHRWSLQGYNTTYVGFWLFYTVPHFIPIYFYHFVLFKFHDFEFMIFLLLCLFTSEHTKYVLLW